MKPTPTLVQDLYTVWRNPAGWSKEELARVESALERLKEYEAKDPSWFDASWKDQIETLRAEACRWYKADGTFEVMESTDAVVERREAAARALERMESAIRWVLCDAKYKAPEQFHERSEVWWARLSAAINPTPIEEGNHG